MAPGAEPPQEGSAPLPADVYGGPRRYRYGGAAAVRDEPVVDAAGRRALIVGLGLAAVLLAVPFTRFVLRYLGILVHELGHTVASWAFGYPALPAFDFTYGGGVTISGARTWALPLLVVAAFLWLIRRADPRRGAQAVLGGLLAFYVVAALTPLHEALILALGHGGELLFAGLAFYRAATGTGCLRPRQERPLYAMVAWFLTLDGVVFAWGLLTDPGRQQLYADAKGGGHWVDFSRLAHDYLRSGIALPAGLYLAACLKLPGVVYLALYLRGGGGPEPEA